MTRSTRIQAGASAVAWLAMGAVLLAVLALTGCQVVTCPSCPNGATWRLDATASIALVCECNPPRSERGLR